MNVMVAVVVTTIIFALGMFGVYSFLMPMHPIIANVLCGLFGILAGMWGIIEGERYI